MPPPGVRPDAPPRDDERLLQDLLGLPALLLDRDLGAMLERVTELSARHVSVDGPLEVGAWLVQDGHLRTAAWRGERAVRADQVQLAHDQGPCLAAVASRRVQHIDDLAADRRWPAFAADAGALGVGAVLSVPMVARGRALGALNLYADRPGAFGEAARRRARIIADFGAVALGNAQAYADVSTAAAMLQRRLLPAGPPAVPGFDLGVHYEAAAEGWRAGGDWWDAVPCGPGRVAVTVGDVAGHGLEAAALMGQVRIALRAYLAEGHEPAAALDLLHSLFGDLEPEALATAAVVALEAAEGGGVRARWATAGHPPPLLVPPRGPACFPEGAAGVPIGAPATSPCPQQDAELAPATTVVLYTDGLVERRGFALDHGLARLAAAADPIHPPARLCATLRDRLLGAGPHEDDVALLAVRAGPVVTG